MYPKRREKQIFFIILSDENSWQYDKLKVISTCIIAEIIKCCIIKSINVCSNKSKNIQWIEYAFIKFPKSKFIIF